MTSRIFLLIPAALMACSSSSPAEPGPVVDTDGAVDVTPDNTSDTSDTSVEGSGDGAAKDSGRSDTGSTGTDVLASCGPHNCTGCCESGVCQPGGIKAACGTGGTTCAKCNPSLVYTCLPTRACGFEPTVTWSFSISSATIPPKNGATDWDPDGGLPDAYVQLYCPPSSTTFKSSATVGDTLTPSFVGVSCSMTLKNLLSTGFAIEVFDDDLVGDDIIMPKTTIVPKLSDVEAGSLTITVGGAKVMVTIHSPA